MNVENSVSREAVAIAAERLKSEQRARKAEGKSPSARVRERKRRGVRLVSIEVPPVELVRLGLLAETQADDVTAITVAAQAIISRAVMPQAATPSAPSPPVLRPPIVTRSTVPGQFSSERQAEIIREWIASGLTWRSEWGAPPHAADSKIDKALLERFRPQIRAAMAKE